MSGSVRNDSEWTFVGIDGAPEVAAYAYTVLRRKVSMARRDHMAQQPKACKPATKTARGDAFAAGWVIGVMDLVQQFSGTDSHNTKIAAYVEQRWPDVRGLKAKDRVAGRNVRPDSGQEGYSQGRKANLHGAVGGVTPSVEPLRLGGA